MISAQDARDDFYTIEVAVANRADSTLAATGFVTYVVSAPDTGPLANTAPTAVDDSVTLETKAVVDIPVLTNDFDSDGDSLTIIAFSQGSKGAVSYNADGTLAYAPGKRFKTSDRPV